MTQSPSTFQPDLLSTELPEGDGRVLIRRIRLLSGMAVSAAIFWFVGPWVVAARDISGPVTLVTVEQGVIAMAEFLGLAVIAAGLAVAISGAGSADRGSLAIAVGLAALGLRGSQMDSLVLYRLDEVTANMSPVDPFPTAALIAESWLWLALIAVGFVVGHWVDSWFDSETAAARAARLEHAPDVRQGLGAIAIVTLVAWSLVSFVMGPPEDPLLKGQIYFSVGLAFLIGSMLANWLFRLHSRVWLLAAVALVATAAYLVAGPDEATIDAARKHGSYITLRAMVRPLPVEYAALGAIGVLLERDARSLFCAVFGIQMPDSRS